jgi:hypothetical protein
MLGASQQNFITDRDLCTQESFKIISNAEIDKLGIPLSNKEIYMLCMNAKGWSTVTQNGFTPKHPIGWPDQY